MYNALNPRGVSLLLATLIYATLRTGALFDILEHLLLPGLASASPLGFKLSGALIQALSLMLLITWIEKIVLSWMTRRIRGDWIYRSSSGNWGHVRISLRGSKLRYGVDLYQSKADLLRVIEQRKPATSIGSGYDRMSLYTGDTFYVWYYVPPMRVDEYDYAERQGMLTLTRTNDRNRYSARWERTGVLGQSSPDPAEGVIAEVKRRDQRSPAGSFYFFVRKKIFLRDKETFEG